MRIGEGTFLFLGLVLTVFLSLPRCEDGDFHNISVEGAVVYRGVLSYETGMTVGEAVEKAGGVLPGCFWEERWNEHILAPGDTVSVVCFRRREGKININIASAEELDELPGIGEVLSERIVEHRREFGPYPDRESLTEVKGIGEKKLRQLYNLITT